jgi:leader peptidase (prepilin peptidase) / N-methyltransferase
VALLASLLGAVFGWFSAWPAARLSVEFGQPPLAACAACSAGFPTWVRPSARCGSCKAAVGASPVWTALAGAIAWGLLAWAVPVSYFLAACLFLATAGVLLSVIDLKVLRLPNPIVLVCLAVTLVLLAAQALVSGDWSSYWRALLGGAAGFGAYFLFALLPGAPMGFGDVKLAGVLALTLGYLGWPAVIVGLILPFLVNGPFAVVALARRGRKAVSPFGPALLAGWLIATVILFTSIF